MKMDDFAIREEDLAQLGERAYELSGESPRKMFLMLLCLAEMVYEQAKYNARCEGERKGTVGYSIQLRKEARKLATIMTEELRSRYYRHN